MAKRALVIGVKDYPNLKPEHQLRGCLNDVEAWRQLLVEQFAFEKELVVCLANPDRKTILAQFESHLIAASTLGDLVVFAYSGHGSYTWDLEGDEADDYDETIVPSDCHYSPLQEPAQITDDELYDLNARLLEKLGPQGFAAYFFDCCHAGTQLRGLERARLLPPELPPRPVDLPPRRTTGEALFAPDPERYVVLSACQDDQKAYETTDVGSGRSRGAFSLALNTTMQRCPGATYAEIFDSAAASLRKISPAQRPHIEGNLHRQLFGNEQVGSVAFLPVAQINGDQAILGGGSAHQVTPGSAFDIYAPHIRSPQMAQQSSSARLGTAVIVSVDALTCTARVTREGESVVKPGCRAFETLHRPGELRIPVSLIGDSELVKALETKVRQSPLFLLDPERRNPRLVVWCIHPERDFFTPGDLELPLGLPGWPCYVVTDPGGNKLLVPHPAQNELNAQQMSENLERIARCLNLIELENRNPVVALNGKVKLALKKIQPQGESYIAQDLPVSATPLFVEGERVGLSITNHHDQPIYISVLDIGLSWQVSLLYPPGRASERLAPGRTILIGLRPPGIPTLKEAVIPVDFPADQPTGEKTFKVLVTTGPADFTWLVQSGAVVPAFRGDQTLSSLLSLIRSGRPPTSRGFRGEDFSSPDSQSWWAGQAVFRLARETDPEKARKLQRGDGESLTLADENQPRLRQVAVIAGIGVYQGEFEALENALYDARTMAEVLSDEYGFALLPGNEPLLDAAAGLEAIRTAVQDSLAQADAETRWLFYFAGHGLTIDGKGYLVPVGAQHKSNLSSLLPIDWLLNTCKESRCAEALIILDACYAGRALLQPDMLNDLIPIDQEERVRMIVTSGNPDQPVLDGGGSGHSIFTQSLLEALRGWAGIHENNGSVRFMRLLDHLASDIPVRLQAMGLNAISQQPVGGYLFGNRERRDFMFQTSAPRLDPELVRAARSDDPLRRKDSLERLPASLGDDQNLRSLAVELARAHLVNAPGGERPMLVTSTLTFEPARENRAAAALTLGKLGHSAAVPDLLDALGDEPDIFRAAAQALGMIRSPESATRLVEWLGKVEDDLFLPLVDAIGSLGMTGETLQALKEALHRGKLVPFIGPDLPQGLTGVSSRSAFTADFARYAGIESLASLAQVAETATRGGQQRHSLVMALKEAYDQPLQKPGSFYDALKSLGAPFWLSACYDSLLAKSLDANSIVMGEDTKYWRSGRPTVVRLFGDPGSIRGLVVLEKDYELLRENEGDRKLLLGFLQQELQGKIVLLLGFDPATPDFTLLSKYIINQHLAGLPVRVFLVWPKATPAQMQAWGKHPIHLIQQDSLKLVMVLHALSDKVSS